MKKALIYFVLSVLCGTTVTLADTGNPGKALQYYKNAEKQYLNQRYAYAIPLYQSSLSYKGKYDSLAMLHLADAYWQIKNYDSCLNTYVIFEKRFGSQKFTTQRIAELQATIGNYADAIQLYQQLIVSNPELGPQKELFKRRVQGFSQTNNFLKDSLDTKLQFLKLNSTEQDFSPQIFQHELVFVSNRFSKKTQKGFGWDDLPFSQVYRIKGITQLEVKDTIRGFHYTARKETISQNHDYTQETSNDNNIIVLNNRRVQSYGEPSPRLEKFSDLLNSRFNFGPLCFNKAGTKVYFTRNGIRPVKGRFNLEICEAEWKSGRWDNIRVMPFVNEAYDYFHPALSTDETMLYFCSNKPGGEGGSDIYYINLGDEVAMKMVRPVYFKINTTGNELFPTIKEDMLYFSSDGHPGLGGLDIYSLQTKNYQTAAPKNLGYPYNSAFDDFGLVFDSTGQKGFLSSNRLGSDDIFQFLYEPYYLNLKTLVLNKLNSQKLDLSRVQLKLNDEQKIIDSSITDLTANVSFPIKPGRTYTLYVSREGFYPDSVTVAYNGKEQLLQLDPIRLRPIPPPLPADTDQDGIPDDADKCPGLKGVAKAAGCPDIQARLNELAKMVFFKTASAELTPAAIKPLTEAAEIIKDYPDVTLDIEGHTDNRASAAYNKDLSQRRANTVKNFFVKKGFDARRFTAVGYGLERPIATNATDEGRAMNRRVALKANFK